MPALFGTSVDWFGALLHASFSVMNCHGSFRELFIYLIIYSIVCLFVCLFV